MVRIRPFTSQPQQRGFSPQARAVFAAIVFAALQAAGALAPSAVAAGFARSAAVLAGVYFGVPAVTVMHEGLPAWSLEPSGLPGSLVSISCAAFTFFTIAASLVVWRVLEPPPSSNKIPRRFFHFFATAAGLWCFTVAVNSLRLVASVYASAAANAINPEYWGIVHQFTGMAVFFPSLVLLDAWMRLRHHGTHHARISLHLDNGTQPAR